MTDHRSDPRRSAGTVRYESIQVEVEERIATVTMDRPQHRNAVDGVMAAELVAALREADADADVDAVVLTGSGGNFCAGADLKAVGTDRANTVEATGDGPMGPTRLEMSKPVIAAVEGYAVAGGLELAAWCDLRVAAKDAVFGVFCRRWGVPLIDGGTVRLPRLIGMSRALDMILTGRPVPADEAFAFGLANRLVEPGTARRAAQELAREIAGFPQVCLRNDRRSVYRQNGLTEEEALRFEIESGLESLRRDGVHGAKRFARGAGRHGVFE